MQLEVDIFKKLKDFDLNVHFIIKDECVGFMGSSGSGKSMILKCIAGIETPDRGRIVYNDRIFFDSEKKINLPPQKRRVGYLR
ncbi:MAG: ATP-binding cassette domain-containing protein, partial [Floccifex sp.]